MKRIVVAALLAAGLAACPSGKKPAGPPADDPVAVAEAALPAGDAAHGAALAEHFQCNRCHAGPAMPAAKPEKDCVGCHASINAGTFKAEREDLAKWQPIVHDLGEAPTFTEMNGRLSRAWIEQFLQKPVDLRPHLVPEMPRLAIDAKDARDLATWLTQPPRPAPPAPRGDALRGRALVDKNGCATCHAFTGVPALAATPVPFPVEPALVESGARLAPDLAFTRERMTRAAVVAWMQDPRGRKPDAKMPPYLFSPEEAADIAEYVLHADLTAPSLPKRFTRLPLLDRKVGFDEVNKKVFHRTCWHCHSEPDYAIGDGGPGNSGVFGFKPRGVDLSSYAGIASGRLVDEGGRASLFLPTAAGLPRLVDALVSRHAEESGAPTGDVRGMPLGYPPLDAEEIQLVDSWIAQGRPR